MRLKTKIKTYIPLFLIIVLLIDPIYLQRVVQADSAECGDWEMILPDSFQYRIEVKEIPENENDNCDITLEIKNTTEGFFFGKHGLSYQIWTHTDNIAPKYSYANDATIDFANIPKNTITGHLVPGNYLFNGQPLRVTLSPSDILVRGGAWINFEKSNDAMAFDLALIFTDIYLGIKLGPVPTCTIPDSWKMVIASIILDKNYETFFQITDPKNSLDFIVTIINDFDVNLKSYLSGIADHKIDCLFDFAEDQLKPLMLRQAIGWFLISTTERAVDVFSSRPIQIYLKYSSPIEDFAELGYIEDGTLYLMRLGTSPVIAYSNPSAEYVNFEFSPDGRLIAAVRVKSKEEGYGHELNVIDRLTKEVIYRSEDNVYSEYHDYETPIKWSPDGTLFLFNKILVRNNGNVQKEIIPDERLGYANISWMPGSQSVVYIKEQENYQGLELIRYNVLFGLTESLGVFPVADFGYCTHIQDPVTGWIAVLGGCVEGEAALAMLHPNGEIRLINQGKHIIFRGLFTGKWSPKGGMFVYTAGRPYAKASVMIYDVENNTETTLPGLVGSNPTWSPDGERIAFTSPKGGLVMYDLNTGELQDVLGSAPNKVLSEEYTFGGGKGELLASWQMIPSWSPNSRFIILPYPDSVERWDGNNPNKESDAGFYVVDTVSGESYWFDNGIRPQWIPE